MLTSISSIQNSIICLSILFEKYAFIANHKLFVHLNNIDSPAIKIFFPLIQNAFIGYLNPEQLFLLFDRILGFRSLDILPLVALGIYIKNSKILMQLDKFEDIKILDLENECMIDLVRLAL